MTTSAPPRPRAWAVGTGAALVLTGLTACTAPPPTPDAAATALAEGLAQADLGQVPLDGTDPAEATAELVAAIEPLEMRPSVEVGEVTVAEEGDTATARLDHVWDVDEGDVDWTYSTTARLTLVEVEDGADEWRVTWSPGLAVPDLSAGETLQRTRTRAERAPVLGADGAVLVEPRPVRRLGIDKTWVDADTRPASARALAEELGLDPDAYAERVAAAGEKAFVEAIVLRADDPDHDVASLLEIDGARAVDDELPLAPTRAFARQVLGTAGPATAEVVEASEGAVAAGDTAGLSGLQRQYDALLRGRAGVEIRAVRADGGGERVLFRLDPVPGEPLRTTLDLQVQQAADEVLADVEPAAALVALEASSGAVLAVASGTGGGGHSTATVGTFAPGSVFKVASSLALLRAGLSPDSPVECPTSIEVEGRVFENFPGYPSEANGTVDLRTALAHSCNTAFIGQREAAPPAALAEAAASLGLGGETVAETLGFPAFMGDVPTDSTGTDHAASMIGQGRVQVSPLGMAGVAASVVAGTTVTPWLVGAEPPQAPAPAVPLTAEEAGHLRTLMRAVVTDGGAPILADAGDDVLAKTGTAQAGAGDEMYNHAWMIGARGDLAVAVLVENGDLGSTTAGPLLAEFLESVDRG